MRRNPLFLPAVSLLAALLATTTPTLTATAKTCFCNAVCNNTCSKQAKPDNAHARHQFVDKARRLAPTGFAGNQWDYGLKLNFTTLTIEYGDALITGTGQGSPYGQNSLESKLRSILHSRDCQSIMKLQGFLTRAQFVCGFTSYSDEMIQKARDCAQSLTESQTMELLASGMKAFDLEERERGRARICEEVLRDFPGVIRK